MKIGKYKIDFIFRLGSFWMGCHYSSNYQSICVALIPCCVIRIGLKEYKIDPDIIGGR